MKRSTGIWSALAAAVAVTAVSIWTVINYSTAAVSFEVIDAVSGSWVWDSTIKVQDKYARGFFQTLFTFSGLQPGKSMLHITAPAYNDAALPIKLHRGNNILDEPIALAGREIPDLTDIVVFEDVTEEGIVSEYHLIGRDGSGIGYHPCIDIVILVAVYDQTEGGSERGMPVFQGMIPWEWDDRAEGFFRYSSHISISQLQKGSSPYLVIDYLILIPETGENSADTIRNLLQERARESDPKEILSLVSRSEAVQTCFQFTSWDVKRNRQ